MTSLFLASGSPRRHELLLHLGYAHQRLAVDVPEQQQPQETAITYVTRLALSKAEAGLQLLSNDNHHHDALVLGADTVVVCDDQVLEKPIDRDDFERMMNLLADRAHQTLTAVALVNDKGLRNTVLSTTTVTFGALDAAVIAQFWATGEPLDKAGGYGIQGFAGRFIRQIDGSYHGVMGLPLYETDQLLRAAGCVSQPSARSCS